MIKLFISLMAIALLAACSTPQTRARAHAELMETLTPEERAMVEAGEVDLGFTEEMVLVALGEPDRKFSERTADREAMIWSYNQRRRGLSAVSFGVGTSVGGGRGASYGGGVSVGTGGRPAEERLRVVFEEGRVASIDRAE